MMRQKRKTFRLLYLLLLAVFLLQQSLCFLIISASIVDYSNDIYKGNVNENTNRIVPGSVVDEAIFVSSHSCGSTRSGGARAHI